MSKPKLYEGMHYTTAGECMVLVDGKPLSPDASLKIRNHSPTGFSWGYGGSGPAQLALAILLDYFADPALAQAHYQSFKWDFVARWPGGEGWTLSGDTIDEWMQLPSQQAMKFYTLTELEYSTDRTGPWQLYVYGADGYHSGGQWFDREPLTYPDEQVPIGTARAWAEAAGARKHEVRVCDGGDKLVFHSKDGQVLYGADFWEAIA